MWGLSENIKHGSNWFLKDLHIDMKLNVFSGLWLAELVPKQQWTHFPVS